MYIINLDSLEPGTPGIGQKASNLSVLIKNNIPVPMGFVITSEAFDKFLTDTWIGRELPGITASVRTEEPRTAFEASQRIRQLFLRVSGNDFLIRELKDAYSELCFGKDANIAGGAVLGLVRAGRTENFVSVRPSFICPGSEFSFSGHGKAVLNQISHRQILSAVKDCWLSAFSPESLFYRKLHGIEQFSLAVIVQRMVDSDISGTLFTSEPVSGQKDKALLEGFWGLGETLCCGCLSPDQYIIDKASGNLISKRTGKKMWLRRRGPLSGNTIQEKVPMSRVLMDTLTERDFPRFASTAKKLEEIFKAPMEAEWCVERGRVVLTQAKPVVFSKNRKEYGTSPISEAPAVDFSGLGLSAGSASGKVLAWREEMPKPESPGILLAKNLGMELFPYMNWFSGIITEQGGSGSCMASLGRELGIPIVTGIENATILLQGKELFMDGISGAVSAIKKLE